MSLKSDGSTYGLGTRAIHWGIALFILALIASGYLADDVKAIIPTHKAVGIFVLALGLIRLLWWLLDGPRPGDENMGPEKYLAKAVKWALAAVGIAMPLSGWLMSSAADKPIMFFGLFQVPPLLAPDKPLAGIFKESHETIGSVLVILLGLHVAGALRHHFLVKDNILTRMLPCAIRLPFGRKEV